MSEPATSRAWGAARIAAAALILAAIVAQLQQTVANASAAGREIGLTVVNFFSFFTVLSNALSVVVLLAAGAWLLRASEPVEPRPLALALAAVSTYMIVTGVVYNLLLRGYELPQGTTVPWSNEVLHVVGPLYLLVDVLFAVRRRRLDWSAVGVVLVFPIVWVTYTMIRGPLTTNPLTREPWWYPYPFLNWHVTPGGIWGVVGYIISISVAISGIAVLVVWCSRRRAQRSRTTRASSQTGSSLS